MRYLIIFTVILTLAVGTKAYPVILTQLTTNPGNDWTPTWSPDGSTIAYSSSPSVMSDHWWDDNSLDIWAIPAGGGTPTKLADFGLIAVSPKYSPDGSKILFTSRATIYGAQKGIFSMPATGGPRTVVFDSHGNDYAAQWSPDGNWIVFATEMWVSGPGGQNIGIVSSDGSSLRRLTYGNPGDGNPTWSPEGSTIAFQSYIRSDNDDIWTISPDGSNLANLTNTPGWGEGSPAYSPDGH